MGEILEPYVQRKEVKNNLFNKLLADLYINITILMGGEKYLLGKNETISNA